MLFRSLSQPSPRRSSHRRHARSLCPEATHSLPFTLNLRVRDASGPAWDCWTTVWQCSRERPECKGTRARVQASKGRHLLRRMSQVEAQVRQNSSLLFLQTPWVCVDMPQRQSHNWPGYKVRTSHVHLASPMFRLPSCHLASHYLAFDTTLTRIMCSDSFLRTPTGCTRRLPK